MLNYIWLALPWFAVRTPIYPAGSSGVSGDVSRRSLSRLPLRQIFHVNECFREAWGHKTLHRERLFNQQKEIFRDSSTALGMTAAELVVMTECADPRSDRDISSSFQAQTSRKRADR